MVFAFHCLVYFTDMSPGARDIKERINKWDLIKIKSFHSRKTNNPIKKWAKDLNKHFSKEDIQRAQRHMKRCSALLAIRKMQITTTMRYHFILVRMVTTNKATNKCWRGCGEKGTLVHLSLIHISEPTRH